MRGAAEKIKCPSFYDKHNLKAFIIAPTAVIAGIGICMKMDVKISEGGTGYYDTNLIKKAECAVKHIDDYDFGFIHIKAVDDSGHDKNIQKRMEMLIKIDEMVGFLVK